MNNPSLSNQELAKYLTLKTFNSCGAYAVFLYKLNADAHLEMIDTFGLPPEINVGWELIPLSHDVPATDSVKEDRMIWLADDEEWDELYPNLRNYPDSTKLKTLVTSPLYLTGSPIGVMGVMSEVKNSPTSEDIAFMDIVAGLVSLHISKHQARILQLEERGAYLTKRQIIILEYISQQMTNMQIARELGYSESTIRHETMRIYELLQASGRREAVAIARKLNLIK